MDFFIEDNYLFKIRQKYEYLNNDTQISTKGNCKKLRMIQNKKNKFVSWCFVSYFKQKCNYQQHVI